MALAVWLTFSAKAANEEGGMLSTVPAMEIEAMTFPISLIMGEAMQEILRSCSNQS